MKTKLLEETYHSFEQAKNGVVLATNTSTTILDHIIALMILLPLRFIPFIGTIKPNRLWKNYYKPKAKEVEMVVV